jgi:nucleotide-binding universal stress UspA family protein
MITIQRILCPTDLTSESDEALRYAVALARAYEAKLLLLNCTNVRLINEEPEIEHLSIKTAGAFQEALCSHLGLTALSKIDWEPLVIRNVQDVGLAIVHQAAKLNIDLIVMRSRRRPHAALLLGSTAETVCRTAPCPVLVTHPREREWVALTTGEIDLQRILVAHDFSHDSEVALRYGASLAQQYQSELHLLHVLSTAGQQEPELAWTGTTGGSAYGYVTRRLHQALSKEVFLWCNCIDAVRTGKASEEIIAYAGEREIDLICIGASGSDRTLSKVFGSNVDRVLRQAPCPILVARPRLTDSGLPDLA